MIRINLLGHETRSKRSVPDVTVGGDNAPFILAVLATLIAVGAAWWWQSRAHANLETRLADVTAEQERLAETAARVRALEERREVVNQRLGVIVDLKKNQSGPVLLLDQISRELSDSLWLSTLTLSEGSVSIAGEALSEISIADFEENLRLSSFFDDTRIESTTDTGDVVNFELSTRFVPLSPPPEPVEQPDDPAAGAEGTGRGGGPDGT